MSTFGAKVFEILDRIGQDAAWLARQTGISEAAISKWKLDGKRQPKPSSVLLVAKAFEPHGVTLDELSEAAGMAHIPSLDIGDRERRLLELVRTNPRAQRVWDRMQGLTPDEVDEMLSMNEAWIAARKGRRTRRS